jgi:hypothetical protein
MSRNYNNNNDEDDVYPAADPIPDPSRGIAFQYGELVRFLTDSHDMRMAAKSSLKAGLWAGGGAVGGAFLFGPLGGLIGGVTGSIIGFFRSDDYDGAVSQIMKLDEDHQRALMKEVGVVLMAAGASAREFQTAEAFHSALVRLAAQESVRNGIWQACLHSIEA